MRFSRTRCLVPLVLFSACLPFAARAQQPNHGPEKLYKDPDMPRPDVPAVLERESDDGDADSEFPLKRQQWFNQLRAYPFDHIPAGARWRAILQHQAMLRAHQESLGKMTGQQAALVDPLSTVVWTPDGPQPVAGYGGTTLYSGRADAIAVDPENPQIIYLGTAAGGVWKTTDGGQTWKPIGDFAGSLAIGSIAVDPNNSENIYAGTGEPDFSADSYYGVGLLKSTNGGLTWTLIRLETNPWNDNVTSGPVAAVAVQPGDSNVVLASALDWWGGIFRSTDAGRTWTQVSSSKATSLLFDKKNPKIVYAGTSASYGGSDGPLLKSTDAGLTWNPMNGTGTNVVPAQGQVIRAALAQDNAGALYAALAGPLYKSTDGGANWIQLASPGGLDWYRNAIAVVPNNPQVMYAAGFNVSQSVDGGKTWSKAAGEYYADQHAFAFSPDGSKLYLADDGGIFVNNSPATAAANFTSLNETINTLTFYPYFSIIAGNPNSALAGSQDHGVNLYLGDLAWPNGEQSGVCGDGNGVYVDPKGENAYVHCQGGWANWAVNHNGAESPGTYVAAQNGIDKNDRWPWVADIKGDQKTTTTVYTGTNRLYQSLNAGGTWTAISPDLTNGGVITTIGVSPNDSTAIYVGSNDGKLSVTTSADKGAAATWTTLSGLPNRAITKVVVAAGNDKLIYVTVSGFASGHVFRSSDGGATFKDISTNLPDTPANSIAIDPNIPATLYLATDTGVYVTENSGQSWTPMGSRLPNVVIQDILVEPTTRTVRVISHGRGAWDAVLKQIIPVNVALDTAPIDSPASVKVTFTLNLPAPSGGATLTLTSSNQAAFPVPATFLIPAGSTNATLSVQTGIINAATSVRVSAAYSGATASRTSTLYPGSFTLTSTPASASAPQGKTLTFSINAQSKNNFASKIALAAKNLPAVYTVSGTGWNPATVTPVANGSAASTFTLITNSATLPGKYSLAFSGSAGGYSVQTITVPVTITEAPTPKISSISPGTMAASATTMTLKIVGANFLAGDTLTVTPPGGASFPSVAANLKVASATEIDYSFNNGSTPGKWSVAVNSPDGTSHSNVVTLTVTSTGNNPAPVVTGLSPGSAWMEASPRPLKINGSGFLYSSAVTYNGTAHTATYLSPTQLEVQLSSQDLALAGSYPLVVTNPVPGGGSSAAVKFTVTFGPWAWMGGSQNSNQHGVAGTRGQFSAASQPGSRQYSVSWTDPQGNFWLFGGLGFDAGTYLTTMNDLWEYSPSKKQWAWMSGGAAGVYYGSYGSKGLFSTANVPGSRGGSSGWIDSAGNLWLFGGGGWDAGTGAGLMNDLWEYIPSSNAWGWISGSQFHDALPMYGTKGTASAGNVPGGRQYAARWVDHAGNLWLFGGQGIDSLFASSSLNDLWVYSPSQNVWTWVGGANRGGQKGVYGTKGTAAATNTPGARTFAANWTDASGNLWLFGGNGYDSTGAQGQLNDLWKFDVTAKIWTWEGGSNTVSGSSSSQQGTYGTQGVASAANIPGGRFGSITWTDASGNFWLMGGTGYDSRGGNGFLNDLWRFDPRTGKWTWMSGRNVYGALSVFGTQGSASWVNVPGSRSTGVGWMDTTGNLWLFGGAEGPGLANDLWRFTP